MSDISLKSFADQNEIGDMTEKRFREVYGYKKTDELAFELKERLWKLFVPTKKSLFNFFPILKWLPRYNFKSSFVQDLITGLTIGTMQIPQGMAYAALAGVLPVFGLYTGFFPVLLYTIFGTSRHLSVGSYALTSIMVGAYLDDKLPLPIISEQSNSSNATLLLENINNERIMHATAITFFSSLFMILFGILHLGFITRLFAQPFQSAFIFGVTVVTMLSQWKHLFGVKVGSYSGPLSVVWTLRDLCIAVFTTSSEERSHVISSIVTSIICIAFLVLVKIINKKYKQKYFRNIPIPGEIIVIALSTLISWGFELEENHGLYVVGPIASGLPMPQFPKTNLLQGPAIVQAFLVAIVGYSVIASLANTFAERGCYKIDSNQELFAFGFCNLFGSVFLCLPSFSAMSRSCVQFESGGKTQIVGWISATIMLLVLLYVGPVFQYLPRACLASIVVVALSGLFKNIYDVKQYWANHKLDAVTWVLTCLATLLLDVTWGLISGICVLLICHLIRTSSVHLRELEKIESTQIYKEKGFYEKGIPTETNVVVVRFEGPLNFFNSETLKKSLVKTSGIDPILEMSKTKLNEATKKQIWKTDKSNSSLKTVKKQNNQCALMQLELDVEKSQTSNRVETIALDCSKISSVDSVGAATLSKIITDYKKIGVRVYIANCSDTLLQSLNVDDVLKISFVSLSEAVKASTKSNVETILID